jgi:hypothetical protein
MAWTGVLGLAVGSVPAYASVHGSKLYVFRAASLLHFYGVTPVYSHGSVQACTYIPRARTERKASVESERPTYTSYVVGGCEDTQWWYSAA